jgi:hypothetical protein
MNKGLDFISFEIQNTTGYAFDSKFMYLFTKDAALTKVKNDMILILWANKRFLD